MNDLVIVDNSKIENPKFSVIIPVYNREKDLYEVLKSIFIQETIKYDFEVVIFDDCSTDKTVEMAKEFPCKIVCSDKQVGPAIGRNIAVENSKGEYIFFLDSDTILLDESLNEVVDLIDNEREVSIGLLAIKIKHNDFASNYKNLYMHYMFYRQGSYTSGFSSGVAVVKRSVFDSINGFDDRYGTIPCEDLELGRRLSSRSKIYINKNFQVEHLKKYSIKDVLYTGYERSKSIIKLIFRNMSKKEDQAGYQTAPKSFIFGVALTAIIALLTMCGILFGSFFYNIAIVFYLLLLFSCRKFLLFGLKHLGILFFIKSTLFIYFELFAIGLGVVSGKIDYLRGNKF